ncbi:extracellular solute-binding protein [Acidothermaceae bacterium B102]|nr:extracellular solute-binding protein [Acidothermaceae bacterium B102]
MPNIDKIVAIWNTAHPDIHVSVNSQAQGDALYTKLTTADKASNPPDLFQAEYQALPTLVTNGVAADISKLVTPIKSKFTDGAWGLTSFGGAAYGIPQDTGPMMLFYRADLFKKYGLAVPTTWAQYASEATSLHAAHPTVWMGTFSSKDPGWFAGLAQQAKSQWWSTSGDTWTVAINDAAAQKVASFWGGLVSSGAIQSQPFFTPQWNTALANGTLLTWPSAVWAPGVLSGSAPKTAGDWEEAPLPAWTAGDTHVGFWGGSATSVSAKSKNQAAAVQFASWLNTDPTAIEALIKQGALYPASIDGQKAPALSSPPAFLSNEPSYYTDAARISGNAGAFTFGPDVNVTYSTYTDAFGKAIQNKSSFLDALTTMQTTTVADMKKAGFKTTG